MIDPQVQANNWIKNMERAINKNNIKELDPQNEKMMSIIETAIANGQIVILENMGEDLDPSLEPVLNKQLRTVNNKLMMYMGEKEILYNPNFRFYMTTKLANPKYKAETQTRVTLVNFTVKQKGLEEQLISVVIQIMEAQLEKSKNDLVNKKSQNEITLRKLDDDILKMLQEIKGSLIDDENLIVTLDKSKETEEEVKKQIETSAVSMKKTFAARENYRSLARIASKLFFVLNDFSLIDHMYQFALSNYIEQFGENINTYQSRGASINDSLQEKLSDIAARHSEEIFKTACRGLFEKDKLLLAIQMAVNITSELKSQITIDLEEYNFFLRGGDPNADRKNQPHNPISDWVTEQQWQSICDLDKLPNFTGIINAFTHNGKEWKKWYLSPTPESDSLPGEWDQKCDSLKKMILLKIIRPDRVLLAAQAFVNATMGQFYTQPPATTYDSIYNDTTKNKPVIFILSPGVDPYHQLEQFAKMKDCQLLPVSLGQGQAQKAIDKLYEGSKAGLWVYLANCHLSLSFLKELEKCMETLRQSDATNEKFRLWLSSAPHPKFPISILQKCLKVTTEPPKGVKANMNRLYTNMSQSKFDPQILSQQKLTNQLHYMKLVYSLCWFHSLIIERKRFKSMGWNVIYDFNDSDWETADNILLMYVDQTQHDSKHNQQQQQQQLGQQQQDQPVQKSPPWDAIRYLIADVIYGGRVTDKYDQRLLKVYANSFFQDKIIFEEKYKLVDNSQYYYIPEEFKPKESKNDKISNHVLFYRSKVEDFPPVERAEVFGQHINAEISSQIADTNALIDSIISLSPQSVKAGEESMETKVQKLIQETLGKVPEEIDMQEAIEKVRPGDQNPLKIVLMQEISRYNKLLNTVRTSLINLDKGLSGLVLISEDLETIMHSLFDNKVPQQWKFCYSSLKPLSSWIIDLEKRVAQLRMSFGFSGFSFPTGFTTALLQQSARKVNTPIDQFGWEFSFLPHGSEPQAAKDGAYIHGLFLEGAKWDEKNYIVDAEPMKLHDQMPIVLFKPQNKERYKVIIYFYGQNFYLCPTYYYQVRCGVMERPSYQFDVMLPCKPNPGQASNEEDFWIKRGTALLMQLSD
ncbi:unnamed protein product (macronuclear) [Paramecium tetraurelia]|uniref:Dynein heavy chain n=1 Tax=Paramecium tetraurelia TaxID=5888 RepID=A0DXN7_PARTE|nr:uncharacterized protein GSPATT00021428001 [Paramecium tetraurelia]CAK87804.1 unnamed protein product [Paramecium tetraurelia]|eukprot:XP_001455201.1 hypothetical protein (macronuclear) [Paramecium tetraurelia strain d4-2]